MMIGELSGAGLPLPVELPLAEGDWRFALVLWSIPLLLIALLVALIRAPRDQSATESASLPSLHHIASLPKWNDLGVWHYGLLLGRSVVAFFEVNAYSGLVLQARGEYDAAEEFPLAYNTTPLLASFAVLRVPRWVCARAHFGLETAV